VRYNPQTCITFQFHPFRERTQLEEAVVPDTLIFQQMTEPNEGAFSILVPQGWRVEGGILRVDPMMQTQSAQAIAAKVDFAVKCDTVGTVMMRWLPEMLYCDMRFSPAGMMGLFPPGSNYQGMTVSPVMPPQDFLATVVFPSVHPQAMNLQIVDQKSLPALAQKYHQRLASVPMLGGAQHAAASVTFTYVENAIRYREKGFTVIENLGQVAGGMWSNKESLYFRAPEDELEKWRPVLSHIQRSVRFNPQWLQQETMGQMQRTGIFRQAQQAAIARDQRMMEIQRQVQEIDRQIVEHQQRTNAEIQNDVFLTLTEQEEYMNPYTGDIDYGSNQWNHRWVTADGDEFYADDEYADPNITDALNRTDWKRTQVRPRFPQ
jgi:hypothetical protein